MQFLGGHKEALKRYIVSCLFKIPLLNNACLRNPAESIYELQEETQDPGIEGHDEIETIVDLYDKGQLTITIPPSPLDGSTNFKVNALVTILFFRKRRTGRPEKVCPAIQCYTKEEKKKHGYLKNIKLFSIFDINNSNSDVTGEQFDSEEKEIENLVTATLKMVSEKKDRGLCYGYGIFVQQELEKLPENQRRQKMKKINDILLDFCDD